MRLKVEVSWRFGFLMGVEEKKEERGRGGKGEYTRQPTAQQLNS